MTAQPQQIRVVHVAPQNGVTGSGAVPCAL
jgi:hypothetical protein